MSVKDEALAVMAGLRDAAGYCRADQGALAARLVGAADMMRRLLDELELAEFQARTNAETIARMRQAYERDIPPFLVSA